MSDVIAYITVDWDYGDKTKALGFTVVKDKAKVEAKLSELTKSLMEELFPGENKPAMNRWDMAERVDNLIYMVLAMLDKTVLMPGEIAYLSASLESLTRAKTELRKVTRRSHVGPLPQPGV